MSNELQGRRVAVLATDGVEQVELTHPWQALEKAGAEVHLIAPKRGRIQAMNHFEKADTFEVTRTLDEAGVADYAMLILPGGVANPDALRQDPKAVQFVKEFMVADKPVAAICHAPWLLVEADVVRGRTLTSWPSLKTDITNAGGEWVDEKVHQDLKLITSRKPEDLPAFSAKVIGAIAVTEEIALDKMVEQTFPASDPLPGPTSIGAGK